MGVSNPTTHQPISRRAFLKAAGATLGGLALAGFAAPQGLVSIQAAGIEKLYRGTLAGEVLESLDYGASWETITRFGSDFAVLGMSRHPAGLAAWLLFQGHTFLLKSADGRTWHTAEWQTPASS